MRILFLTQIFDPEPNFKGMMFAKELVKRGHSVQVLTGFPNYPGGQIYPGYSIRLWQRQTVEGIPILRTALYPSHEKSAVQRALTYGSFALSAATVGVAGVCQADVAYVYHPPTTISLPSTVLRHLRRIPIVADIQDLWPDAVYASGLLPAEPAQWMLEKWCQFAFRQMDRIVVLSPGFKRQLISRGVPAERIHMIYNWCDEDSMRAGERDENLGKELGLAGRFNVVFAGTMGIHQGLSPVLEAAHLLQTECKQVQFVFIGGGIERSTLEQKAHDMQLSNVLFLPRRPAEEMAPILALADVLLVHLRDLPIFRITIPSKTQAYLSAGRPILMAVKGDAADLVEQARAGLTCQPENPRDIADKVRELFAMSPEERTQMGARGAAFYQQHLSLRAGVDAFESVFTQAQSNSAKSRRLERPRL